MSCRILRPTTSTDSIRNDNGVAQQSWPWDKPLLRLCLKASTNPV